MIFISKTVVALLEYQLYENGGGPATAVNS